MKIFNIKTIELEDGSATVNLGADKIGDNVVQTVYLQVSGDGLTSLSVAGKAQEDEDATAMASISMADFTVKTAITSAGIYMVAAEALSSIELTAVGECEVVVKGVK